jgi:hypothetical protein
VQFESILKPGRWGGEQHRLCIVSGRVGASVVGEDGAARRDWRRTPGAPFRAVAKVVSRYECHDFIRRWA